MRSVYFVDVLGHVRGLRFINFSEADVVRHPLVTKIVHAYGKVDAQRQTGARYELDVAFSGQGKNDKP